MTATVEDQQSRSSATADDRSTPAGSTGNSPGGEPRTTRAWRWIRGHSGLLLATLVAVVILLWASVPGLFTSFDPLGADPAAKLQPPSAEHWFGTDQLGRDVYARVVWGTRASLLGAALAVGVGAVLGSALGSAAGWFGGIVDTTVMRVVDVVLSIPGFLFAMTIVMLLGFGIVPAAIAVGLTLTATFARLIRSEVLKARTSNYVEAAVTSGASTLAILRRHVVPNSIAPTLALISVQFGIAIIWIASLSFLGLGAQPPDPEWGRLVSDGRSYIATRGYLTLWPALVVVVVVLSANSISRFLTRKPTDP